MNDINDYKLNNEGMLQVDSNELLTNETNYHKKLEMFRLETINLPKPTISITASKIISHILHNNITDFQQDYDRCHQQTFVKGPPSFVTNYQKNC